VESLLSPRNSDIKESTFFGIVGSNRNQSLLESGDYDIGPLKSLGSVKCSEVNSVAVVIEVTWA